jgi:hypothetical protein
MSSASAGGRWHSGEERQAGILVHGWASDAKPRERSRATALGPLPETDFLGRRITGRGTGAGKSANIAALARRLEALGLRALVRVARS